SRDVACQLLGAIGVEARGVEHGRVQIAGVRVVVQRTAHVDEVAAERKRRARLVRVDAVEDPSSRDAVQYARMEIQSLASAKWERVAAAQDEAQRPIVGGHALF